MKCGKRTFVVVKGQTKNRYFCENKRLSGMTVCWDHMTDDDKYLLIQQQQQEIARHKRQIADLKAMLKGMGTNISAIASTL